MSDSPRDVGQTDSRDSLDSNTPNGPEKKKSRRPANTAFRQQRLKAWQPILTPKTVLPLFFAIGIIFAPIGGLLLYANSLVQEIKINYTHCSDATDTFTDMPANSVQLSFKNGSINDVQPQWRKENLTVDLAPGVSLPTEFCHLRFTIPNEMKPPVLFYYHLTNFYQNHRRYVDSFDPQQLNGEKRSYSDIDGSKCTPLKVDKTAHKPIFPCGLIANSMFNDTFSSPNWMNPPGTNPEPKEYTMNNKTNIAWNTDKDLYSTTKYTHEDVVPPPNWHQRYPNGYTADDGPPDLRTWEAFQVWMRTASLPDFSKLYQRNDVDPMAKGTYEISIRNYFPVTEYGGTKSVLITTRTVMGGRNPFLGIAYIVVGGVCIILGAVFTATHLIKPRKLGDHTYLSWNNTPAAKATTGPSTAVASGREARPGEA